METAEAATRETPARPVALHAAAPPATPDDLDYHLPAAAIAQAPCPERDQARLLVDCGGRVSHRRACDLPELLGPGDVVVVNDTRVLPARLLMRRASGGAVELLLLSERPDGAWEALVRSSRRLREGETVTRRPPSGPPPEPAPGGSQPPRTPEVPSGSHAAPGGSQPPDSQGISVEIGADLGEGRRLVRLRTGGRSLIDTLAEIGAVPLPPYITADLADPQRYQTVFARRPLSAAAPTAGLHFTETLLSALREAGVEVVSVELAIGLDTFRPVTAARLDDHRMHTEQYHVPAAAQAALGRAERVVAVGTTVVRALETWAATGEASGRSGLFIRRPYQWRTVDVLMTNFHLPRSTLLCLLDAFVGPRWRGLYSLALDHGYRFLSFGDAMLVARRDRAAANLAP